MNQPNSSKKRSSSSEMETSASSPDPRSASEKRKDPHFSREKERFERKRKEKWAAKRRELSIPELVFDEELPVSSRREEIKKAIRENQIVVLCGETGSGKSTQLPKICLELGFGVRKLIGHTQPRRIAAISIANRLAQEISMGRQKPLPAPEKNTPTQDADKNAPAPVSKEHSVSENSASEKKPLTLIPPEKLVGYKIRFTDHTSPETCIKLMTDGILLAETQSDRFLNQYEVLIIDEAHERSLNIDFLIGILRRLADKRPDLKIILTSATIDAARFAAHFETETRRVPILTIEGRTYPVDVLYQPIFEEDEDDDEDGNGNGRGRSERKKEASVRIIHDGDVHQAVIRAAETLAKKGPGDMLVFMPTERDIHELVKLFQGESQRQRLSLFRNENVDVLPLYARLPADAQQKIFNPVSKKRRIVIATNVAESSVTVPRIRYVIDSGTARISRYSARSKTQRLPIEPISRASADQRKGRCGRIGPGVCIRLYSEEDYLSREEYTQPEIQRTNLASVILQTKLLRLGRIESFPFIDMPKIASIRDGYRTLFELKALTKASADGELTPLGQKLAKLPVDPRIGRMVLEALEMAKEAHAGASVPGSGRGETGPLPPQREKKRGRTEKKGTEKKEKERLQVDPLREILVIASALTIRDPRERPVEKQGEADAAHVQFMDPRSDFLSFLEIWDFYSRMKDKLSRSQLIKACRQNFLSWNRMREWQDVCHQLHEMVQDLMKEAQLPKTLLFEDETFLALGAIPNEKPEQTAARYDAIHRVLLSGLLSNIGQKTPLPQEYAVGGGGKCVLWPGSGLLKLTGGECPEKGGNAKNAAGSTSSSAGISKKHHSEADEIHRPKAGHRLWGRNLDAYGRILENGTEDRTLEDPESTADGSRNEVAETAETAPRKKSLPAWVMAAEMVETSKRFLRTNAVIDPEWIEPLAGHLVTKTHSEPHWSKQNNQVMVYEKVTLSGLVIVPRRRVPYSAIDPEKAREMFTQLGLVEGNWQSRADFYSWNRELWFELEQVQAKLRRFDYLPGLWKLYEFYDQRIPKTVSDSASLEKWLRKADTETLKSLEMKEEDLVSESADASLAERFPDSFSGEFTYTSSPVAMKKPPKAGTSRAFLTDLDASSGDSTSGDSTSGDSTSGDSTSFSAKTAQESGTPDVPMREIRLFGQVIQPAKPKVQSARSKVQPAKPQPQPQPQPQTQTQTQNSDPGALAVRSESPAAEKPREKETVKAPQSSGKMESRSSTASCMTSSYRFPLEYRFEPGGETDGVTLHATLETVHQLQESALEWGIPGLLEERVAYLIKSLPKELRRKLIPAPDTARAVCARIPFGVGNLRTVLAGEFTRIAGEYIREKDLDFGNIPEALQINIRVSDSQGNILVQSRSLREVLLHVGEQASEKFALVEDSRWTRSGLTSWNFGELPVQVQIESTLLDASSRAGRISAFPMLIDEGKTVGIRLSTSQFQAELNTRRAVMRLFRYSANQELTRQALWMPHFHEMKMQADYFIKTTKTPFADTICDLVAQTALDPSGFPALADMPSLLNRVPRDLQEYERIVKLAKGRISIVVQELPEPLAQLWKAYHAAIRALNGICAQNSRRHAVNDLASQLKIGTVQVKSFGNLRKNAAQTESVSSTKEDGAKEALPSRVALYEPFQPIVDDLDAQIRRLTPPDFLLRTSWKYVKHFARYFRGIEARIQALSGTNSGTRIALTRGMEQIRELEHFQSEYERLRKDFDLRGMESEELEEFRWAIEEYRISLFAQKLGTAMSVSAKRLEKMLDAF